MKKYDPIKLYYFSKFTLVDIYLSFTHPYAFQNLYHFISKFIGEILEDLGRFFHVITKNGD